MHTQVIQGEFCPLTVCCRSIIYIIYFYLFILHILQIYIANLLSLHLIGLGAQTECLERLEESTFLKQCL